MSRDVVVAEVLLLDTPLRRSLVARTVFLVFVDRFELGRLPESAAVASGTESVLDVSSLVAGFWMVAVFVAPESTPSGAVTIAASGRVAAAG